MEYMACIPSSRIKVVFILLCGIGSLCALILFSRATSHSRSSSQAIFDLTGISLKHLKNYGRKIVGMNETFFFGMEAPTTSPTTPPPCPNPPPNLSGNVTVNVSDVEMEELLAKHRELKPGGRWKPENCTPVNNVAILVPFRDRDEHLRIFLRHIHPFLQKQLVSYTIFVIEQSNGTDFNRAFLFNVGYIEALKKDKFDCFVFHDVDLLPENDRNMYTCPANPVLMSSANSKFGYKVPYRGYFGGVTAMSTKHYDKVNGYSNRFFGWGGEDDDMQHRIVANGLNSTELARYVGRYKSLGHKRSKINNERIMIMKESRRNHWVEGLHSTNYTLIGLENRPLFTWMYVQPFKEMLSKMPK